MEKDIVLFGAGRSSSNLIEYLADFCKESAFFLKVVDVKQPDDWQQAEKVIFVSGSVEDAVFRATHISSAAIVISLLPPLLHALVAEDCVILKRNLITASYVSAEINDLSERAKANGVSILMECGLDPGIDHMSAMKVIDGLKREGALVTGFRSFCGGLVAPESDDNPWHYKFTWNPMNVVLAGQGGISQYKEDGQVKWVPYHRLFERTWEVEIPGLTKMEVYPNRDSLGYQSVYGLKDCKTFVRGTIRYAGYSKAWDAFVKAGLTDHSRVIDCQGLTYRQWLSGYLRGNVGDVKDNFADYVGLSSEEIDKIEWLGLFSDNLIPLAQGTSAEILFSILTEKWAIAATDKDMVVMVHYFDYIKDGVTHSLMSWMIDKGRDRKFTAMAKTVGLPLGIVAKLFVTGKVKLEPGVQIPITKEIYEPVLAELALNGIAFEELRVDN